MATEDPEPDGHHTRVTRRPWHSCSVRELAAVASALAVAVPVADGNGAAIGTLVAGFLLVDAVVIVIIWLAMRGRRRPPGAS